MKRRFFAMLLSLAMLFTLAPTAFAADGIEESGNQIETPELENPDTSGTSGGIDWKVESGTLTITPSNSPQNGCTKGQMVENYGTLTKKAPDDADYIAALTKAGYKPSDKGYFYYPNTETWVSDSPWKFLSEQITKVVVMDGVTSIAARAFRLPNVTEVSIPASVISIGKLAFEACAKLNTVNWTGKWEGHAPMAFNGFSRCSSLGNGYELTNWMPACFYVNADSDSIEGTQFTVDFDKLNGRLRSRTTTYPLAMFRSVPKITSATLTSQLNVKYIFEYSGIQSVTIADDQSSIAEAAFRNCKSLTSVVIPSSVTEIHVRAFGDSGLKNITFSGLTSPTFGPYAFENVKLDSVTLNENMSLTEAVKIIGKLTRDGAITDSTRITPEKFANFNAEDIVIDGAEDAAINNQNYPLVKNLTINGAYTSADRAFGNSDWGKETLKTLTIHAPGDDVTINNSAFLRTPLKSVKIEAKNLTFTGDAAFLNTMLLTRVDLTGVDQIVAGEGAKRTFELNTTGDYGSLKVPTRYVYFKNADTYNALAQGGLNKHFLGNTSTYYLVTNGGTVVGEQDGFSAVTKSGYTAKWTEGNSSDDAVTKPVAGRTYYANWVPRQLSDIEVVAENANVSYGTVLSKDNFKVTAVYDNGEREPVTEFSVSPSTALTTPGTVQVTVTYQEKTATCDITVDKASQAAPTSAPTLKDRTYTSITLNTVEPNANGAVAQYSKDGGKTWQDSAEFTDLTSNTTYTFAVRYAEKAPYAASTASATAEFSTLRHSSGSSSNPTYSVTTPSKSENGKVSLNKSTAKKGDTVTVTVTPDAGYQLDKLTVTDKNGNVLKLTDKGDGKYSFTMPDGKVEVKAVFAKEVKTSPFGDVSTDAYYYKAVQWAQEKGITDGISSDLFGPKQPCTRSQIVTFLWRAAGSPEPKGTAAGMTDVVPGSYYAKAVAWAVGNGITTGTAEGTFSPDATCTRAQAVTFLARAQNAKATGKTAFSDVPADSYFADAVAWAQANGVTTGTSETTFSPDSDCTRAQIVTFLYRANQGT